jgi:predicted signal transduction protein with EAL and GGDEF domain
VDGNELYLSASIGICIAPDDGSEVDILVRNADAAMYQAKAQGRNRYHFYTEDLTHRAQERVRLETLLRHAIEAGELSVHFQPKVDARDSSLTGAEALLRWNNPELGSVPPNRFITVAEENGLIIELGAWVMREACRQLALWDRDGFFVPRLSINLSVKQLEYAGFLDQVGDTLRTSGINSSRIEFEITESVIMSVDDSLAMLNRLHAMGVSLSVDDFGTGYSSLTYLKVLPLHTIKVDQSFVNGIGVNPSDEAIIRTIIELSSSLGFVTVAEGVETTYQAQFLRNAGCDQIQGYLYGKPVVAAEFQAHWQGRSNSKVFPASLSAPTFQSV